MLRLPQLSTLAKYTKYNHLSNWVMNKSIITRVHCHEVYSLSLSLSLHWSRGILSLYLFRYTVTMYTLSLSLSLHCHEVYPLSISLATLSRGILSLYLSCSSTIKIQLRVFVYVKADIILISLKRNLFSPWYNWNIANLAMNKKNPLTLYHRPDMW